MSESNPLDSIWVEKYRPKILDDVIIDDYNRKLLEGYRTTREIPNLLFQGPAGAGKTTVAKVLCYDILKRSREDVLYINASDRSGIDVIRGDITSFAHTRSFEGEHKIVILDEADGLSSSSGGTGGKTSSQSALRGTMEEFAASVRFILTANYPQKIIAPVRSRTAEIKFAPPPLIAILNRVFDILKREGIAIPADQKNLLVALVRKTYPDIRRTINEVQRSVINGALNIDPSSIAGEGLVIATDILEAIAAPSVDFRALRQMWISRTPEFSNNYHDLLRGIFNAIAEGAWTDKQKRAGILIVNEAIYKHHIVMDAEINMFATAVALINVSQNK